MVKSKVIVLLAIVICGCSASGDYVEDCETNYQNRDRVELILTRASYGIYNTKDRCIETIEFAIEDVKSMGLDYIEHECEIEYFGEISYFDYKAAKNQITYSAFSKCGLNYNVMGIE